MGETVRKSRVHRPGFGRPQAQKRRQGMPPINKETNAVEGAGVPATPPSSISLRCRGHRLRTAKKKRGCSLSTPAFDASPLHRRSTRSMTWGSATSRRRHDKTMGVVSNPRKRQGSIAATGKSAYLDSLVPTATTALLQPEA